LENCAGWGARSIMAEVFREGNVEKRGSLSAVSYQPPVQTFVGSE